MPLPSSPALPGLPVVISATAVSTTEIDVTATYTGPPAAATYTFSFSSNRNGPYSTVTQASAIYIHSGLAPSTKVYYFANVTTAENPVRTSQNSLQISATTLQNPIAAATPTFAPIAGTYTTPIPFSISCATPGASIYYTQTFAGGPGTTPVIGQPGTSLYTGPINDAALGPLTVNAIAVASGFTQSAVGTVAYTAIAAGALPNMPLLYYNVAGTDSNQLGLLATSAYQAWLANFNFVEYLFYPGAAISGYTYDSNMAAVKAKAAAFGNKMCLTGKYINNTRFYASGFGTESGLTQAAIDTASAGAPWALQKGTGSFPTGGPVVDNTQFWVVNWIGSPVSTLNSGASAWTNGLTAIQGRAKYSWNVAINGTGSTVNQSGTAAADLANPQCDFLFVDNFTWAPNFAGQWNSDSTTYPNEYSTSNPPVIAQQGQNGLASGLAKYRALGLPSGRTNPILYIGNASFLTGAAAAGQGPTVYPSCQGVLDGAFGEACLGNLSYAIMGYTSPHVMFQRMQLQEQSRSSNALAVSIFNTEGGGPFPNSSNYPALQSSWGNAFTGALAMPTNFGQGVATNATSSVNIPAGSYWQATRYALGFACMRQWVFDLDNVPFTSGVGRCWLDEYNMGAGPGGGSYNWMGPVSKLSFNTPTLPISGGQLNGVYVFHYPNCDVYLNPVGNGVINYTLQAGDKKNMIPRGSYNDGANYIVGGVLTLQDADMRIVVT